MHQTSHELEAVFAAFDEIVTTLPSNTTLEAKAYLIEFILKVAAEEQADRNEIVTRSLSYIYEVITFLVA